MPIRRASHRAASQARNAVLEQLKQEHTRFRKAYRDFHKLGSEENVPAREALVQQLLHELTVHAAVEEELLYPAARGAIDDESLIDEAEIEHESMQLLIAQLREMSADDDKYAARFNVLCEYVLHHIKEEEGEMFEQLERARLDWEGLAIEIEQRRLEMQPAAPPCSPPAELDVGEDSSPRIPAVNLSDDSEGSAAVALTVLRRAAPRVRARSGGAVPVPR